MAGTLTHVSKANFDDEVVKSDKPVIVDFWAEWCGPCHMVAPVLEEIAGETDTVKIVKLNVDENPDVAGNYKVMSIPTLVLFEGGEEKKRVVGAQPKKRIVEEFQAWMG